MISKMGCQGRRDNENSIELYSTDRANMRSSELNGA